MNIQEIPTSWPQRQDSLKDQLADLAKIANRLGFCDAADFLEGEYGDSKKESEKPEPLLGENGEVLQSTLKINGKSFRCNCGCNVFHRPDKNKPDIYKCNCCDTYYETVPK